MNSKRFAALLTLGLLLFAGAARAQDKNPQQPPPPPPPAQREADMSVVPLRIQVVFSEFDGEKKISSLPYVLNHNATRGNSRTSLRMGIRVPITTMASPDSKATSVQYHNVGTDIDCLVLNREGSYMLHLELRRSSVYSPEAEPKSGDLQRTWVSGNPVIREFSGAVDALLRDGQTVQSTMATDPVSGRVLRVDVTLNVIK